MPRAVALHVQMNSLRDHRSSVGSSTERARISIYSSLAMQHVARHRTHCDTTLTQPLFVLCDAYAKQEAVPMTDQDIRWAAAAGCQRGVQRKRHQEAMRLLPA